MKLNPIDPWEGVTHEHKRKAEILAARLEIAQEIIRGFAGFGCDTEIIEGLEDKLFEMGAMLEAPCFACGYNGSGFFDSTVHRCAARHHELWRKDDE